MRWPQEEKQGRPLASCFFVSPSLAMTTSLTAALIQVSVSSKEYRVQHLFWEIQMGVKGRRGETRFHGFKLALSQCCFPPHQQLISPVLGLRPSSASCSMAGSFTSRKVLHWGTWQGSKWSAPACTKAGSATCCTLAFVEFPGCCAPLQLPPFLQAAPHTNETQLHACLGYS